MTERRKLPPDRNSITRTFKIPYIDEKGESKKLKIYATAGMYEDGTLGELFLRADQMGSFVNGALDALAVAISLGVQYGVPLEAIVSKYRHSKSEPAGFLNGDPDFKSCSSAFDLLAQWLHLRFCKKEPTS